MPSLLYGETEAPENVDAGWVNDQESIQAIQQGGEFLEWGATQASAFDPKDAAENFLSIFAEEKVLGHKIKEKDQGSAGFCCGFGTHGAAERVLVSEIAKGENYVYKETAPEVGYSGGRFAAGYRFWTDGSTATATCKFLTGNGKGKGGLCPRKQIGKYNLNNYLIAEARDWAGSGLPAEVMTEASLYPAEQVVLVRNVNDCIGAMAQGYYPSVASTQGFKQTRDSNGILTPWGTWNHCMHFGGWVTIAGELYLWLINSWGKYFKGPEGKYPIGTDGGYVHSSVANRMLAYGDSMFIVGQKGARLNTKLLKWGE